MYVPPPEPTVLAEEDGGYEENEHGDVNEWTPEDQTSIDLFDPETVLGSPQVGTIEISDQYGYHHTATLTLYPGVQGRDSALMARGWESVGGTGDNACYSGPAGWSFSAQNGYFVFGTIEFEVEAQGFDTNNYQWQFGGGWRERGKTYMYKYQRVFGVETSSSKECGDLYGGFFFKPDLGGGTSWGPAPIVVAIGGLFTPEQPEGDTDAIDLFQVAALSGTKAISTGPNGEDYIPLPGLSPNSNF